MGAWIASAGAMVAGVSLKAAAILALALGLSLALRRRSARARYLLWSAAIAGALALPLLALCLPGWRVEVPWPVEVAATPTSATPAAAVLVDESPRRAGAPELQPLELDEIDPRPTVPATASPDRPPSIDRWRTGAFLAWLAGAVAVFVWLLAGLAHAARVSARALPLDGERWRRLTVGAASRAGFTGAIVLKSSREVSTPMTWGLSFGGLTPGRRGRGVILLPEGAEAWSEDCLRTVLLHEMLHLARGDWPLQLLAQAACAVYWWNPLAWLAARHHAVERERSCDEAVVTCGTAPGDYATHLLEVASFFKSRDAGPLVSLSMVRRGQLEGRVMRILSQDPARRGHRRSSGGRRLPLTLTASAIVVALATVEIGPAPVAGESESGRSSFWRQTDGRHNFQIRDDGFSLDVESWGDVDFDAETTSLSPGSRLAVETRDDVSSQQLRITADDAGELTYEWRAGGQTRPFDDQARAWLRAVTSFTAGKMEISRLRGEVSSLRGEISSLRGQESALRGEISSVRGQESALRGQISSIRGEISSLRGKISSIRGRESALKGEISSLRGEISSLRAQRRRAPFPAGDSDEELRRSIEETHALIDRRIAEIEDQIAEIEAEIAAFDAAGKISEVQAEIAELDVDGKAAAIRAEIEALDVDAKIAEIQRRQVDPAYRELRQIMRRIAGG